MATSSGVSCSSAKRHKPYKNISFIEKVLSDDAEMMKLFEMWRVDHEKSYATKEEKLKRFGIFKDSARGVYDTHVKSLGGFHECYCGLNVYADITFQEFKDKCCGDESSDDETSSIGK